jgi:hypothetical protein
MRITRNWRLPRYVRFRAANSAPWADGGFVMMIILLVVSTFALAPR